MTKLANNILELIGDTPIVKINNLIDENEAEIYAKLEFFNPLSSVKDRIALNMIEDAEKQGKIKPGDTLVEPTSGNTGIGLAYVSAVKGYKLTLTMPDSMSIERIKILKALGAEIVLTPGADGMSGAIKKADELTQKGYYQLKQFENPANPDTHKKTTAKEILEVIPDLDAFVAGIGTGGTITGTGEALKQDNPKIKIIAVEPEDSAVLSGNPSGSHKIQGIGAGFIPKVLNKDIYDEVITVSNDDAFKAARDLARCEGLFVGISSGAAFHAAKETAKKLGKGKKVVVLLPDTGERYLSTELFSD